MKPKMLATSTPPFKEWKSTRICKKTLDHFKALKNEDSEFFYKLKLDIEHRVECLFWKVLETNQVRRVTCRCCPCGVEDVSPLYIGAKSESDLVEAQGTGNKE